jgi:glutamine cyclotransferase
LKTTLNKEHNLPNSYFGEGCTQFNGLIYQMTYREGKVFVFDAKTLKIVKELNMPG